jgi:hypothetical protein
MAERFPYEECEWGRGDPNQKRWYDALLERTGPENVRARLAQTNAGSLGSIAIGKEISMTIGFAQEWLAWHDKKKAEREAEFRPLAALGRVGRCAAAAAAVFGWLLKIF